MDHNSNNVAVAHVQSILRIANELKKATASYSFCHQTITSSDPLTIADLISLPSPHPLLPSLLEAGVSHEIATAANKIYQQRAGEFKQHIEQTVTTACLQMAPFPGASVSSPDPLVSKVVSTFTEIYLRRLALWREEVIQRVKQAPKTPTKTDPKSSRSFNQEYIPLLEHFFEENPFPTHADKVFLAKKSNMEYRQIHVWFQNRRSRTKKEGKTMRKKPVYEGATKPLDKLRDRMKGYMADSNSQVSKPSKGGSSEGATGIETARINVSEGAFTSSSPSHAFPSSYPPTCHYDPFPCRSGPVRFSKPEWRRVSCGKSPLSHPTSIDDLAEAFSHLNVRDETRSRGSPKLQSHAATVAITIIPSRAPHPSLIVRKYIQPTNIVHLHPLVRAPISCSKGFQSPSPTLKPVTLIPLLVPPNKSELPRKRKTAPLPQRFPGRVRNSRRDATPSDSSSTSSSSPCLFSTNPESSSCSLSSVSSLSTPSDVASIQELPQSFGSPCRSPSDSPIHLRGLGDMVAISSSVS